METIVTNTYSRLIIILFLLCTVKLYGQPLVRLDSADQLDLIGKAAYYYQDLNDLTTDAILSEAYQAKFAPYHQDIPNFASTPAAVWLRFRVQKRVDEDFYLQVGSAYIDSIFLYEEHNSQLKLVHHAGDDMKFSDREILVPPFLFKMDVPLGAEQTYYLRTKCMQPLFFPLRVGTLKSFMEDQHKLDFMQGIYFGFMFLIFLYNLFLFFSTRESIYLHYVFYVVSITLFMSFIYHYFFQYVWPDLPIVNRYAVVSSAMTIFTAVFFSRRFLITRVNTPRLHWISNVFLGIAGIIVVLLILQLSIQALLLAQISILLMAVYFLILGVAALRNGYTPAKFYLVAWSALILGFIAAILESLNIVPVSPYINSMQIGSAIEVTLLSFALADRINIYKKQREEAQAQALAAAQEKNAIIAEQNVMLEKKVEERTRQIKETLELVEMEKVKSDVLLLNILPQSTAQELKENGTAEPKYFESVSVLFLDVKGFSTMTEQLPAEELVARLDRLFQNIDEIVISYGLEKIKTIGDAYMAAGGIPLVNNSHPLDAVRAAIDIQNYLQTFEPDSLGQHWQMRCGIHTGPVAAGVVGRNKFAYDIWGNTVNLAARLETTSEVGKINISESTYQHIKSEIPCTYRGDINVKNMGKVRMYYVDQEVTDAHSAAVSKMQSNSR